MCPRRLSCLPAKVVVPRGPLCGDRSIAATVSAVVLYGKEASRARGLQTVPPCEAELLPSGSSGTHGLVSCLTQYAAEECCSGTPEAAGHCYGSPPRPCNGRI